MLWYSSVRLFKINFTFCSGSLKDTRTPFPKNLACGVALNAITSELR